MIGPNGAGKSTMIKAWGETRGTGKSLSSQMRHRSRHWWVSCQLPAGQLFGNIPMSGPEDWLTLDHDILN